MWKGERGVLVYCFGRSTCSVSGNKDSERMYKGWIQLEWVESVYRTWVGSTEGRNRSFSLLPNDSPRVDRREGDEGRRDGRNTRRLLYK